MRVSTDEALTDNNFTLGKMAHVRSSFTKTHITDLDCPVM